MTIQELQILIVLFKYRGKVEIMMKRKIVSFSLIVMIIAGLFILTGCKNKKENMLDPNKEYVKINIPDNGSTLNHMAYVILDENIIKHKTIESEDTSKYKNMQGYSVETLYYFEGLKEGKTEIWVIDMFPGEIQTIFRYEIHVDSNLNAKVVSTSDILYRRIKCAVLNYKADETQINIEDNSIARNVYIWRWGDDISIVGLKQGTTTMIMKEKNGTEKKYIVKVDADLNVELEEM